MLAVVGGVVGAIWYAAAKFYEDYKVSKTVEEIFSTARNIQNLISIRDAEMIGNGVNITATLLSAGSYPKNWIQGNNVKNLFGLVNTVNTISPAPPRFDTYFSLNNSSCILLINKITTIASMTRDNYATNGMNRASLGRISINWPMFGTQTFPVTIEVAKTYCNLGTNVVVLSFGYTRINN